MKDDPVLESQRSDHLFLLIGTNPLPNYVAAKLLLKPGGKTYMVHSCETYDSAQRLKHVLGKEKALSNSVMINVDEADAQDINKKVSGAVDAIQQGTVGLNYTGGTKVMAVHAYRAFRSAVENNLGLTPICSYLDARKYKMRFDPIGHVGYGKDVLMAVTPSLQDLLELHKIRLSKKSPDRAVVLPDSAKVLAEMYTDKEAVGLWRQWCNHDEQGLRKQCRRPDKPKAWKNQTSLAEITLKWPTADVLKPVVNQICRELRMTVSPTIELREIKNRGFKKTEHFCAWLDGKWLEHYTFAQIELIADECNLGDRAMSLDTVHSDLNPNFEFDVGVMKGYQLFALSCSTGTALAKLKLFEAYTRARQLGGDEARIALVCPHKSPKTLQKEIPADIQGRIKVFGQQHFIDLHRHLKEWFNNPDKN